MTEEATKQFLSSARGELVRVQIALSEVPAMKLKEELLRDLLILYGEKNVGHGRAAFTSQPSEEWPEGVADAVAALPDAAEFAGSSSFDESKRVPVSEASLKRMQTRADREDRKDPVKAKAHALVPRPADIPTTYQMVYETLREGPSDGLTATLLVEKIRDRWWPGVSFNQIAPEFYRYVNEGRVVRDQDGKMTLTEKGREVGANPNAPRGMGTSRLAKAIAAGKHRPPPMKTVKPVPTAKLTPEQLDEAREKFAASQRPTKAQTHEAFEHNGMKLTLPIAEARLAQHMHNLMGQGCLGVEKLAQVAGVSRGGTAVEDMIYGLNQSLRQMKLQIVPYEKLGFFMKETS